MQVHHNWTVQDWKKTADVLQLTLSHDYTHNKLNYKAIKSPCVLSFLIKDYRYINPTFRMTMSV